MKGGGKPSAALSVGSRAFVNPKTLGARASFGANQMIKAPKVGRQDAETGSPNTAE
jgi:hypothetical protein